MLEYSQNSNEYPLPSVFASYIPKFDRWHKLSLPLASLPTILYFSLSNSHFLPAEIFEKI